MPSNHPRRAMPLRALFVDFNAYFASVEQQLRPDLRDRPIAVLPVVADTTCCIAASYEARRYGIKTGTIVAEAKRLCPELVLVEARPPLYVKFHHQLVAAVESCLHVEKVYSIDEMVCRLEGHDREREQALVLAGKIKQAIAQVGSTLRASIGIAPNTFLAKTASDMQKPDGLTVLEDADLPQALYRLKLRDLSGIGRNMEQRLNADGIHTVQQLCEAGPARLRHAWGGVGGERMHARLKGEWVPDMPSERSSVGHSHVLPPALRTRDNAYSVLSRLTQKAAMRLRSYDLIAGSLALRLRYLNGKTWDSHIALDPTSDTLALLAALAALWENAPDGPAKPLAVGVTLCDLTEQAGQSRSLFDDAEARDRLNQALDCINLKFGKQTVYFGGAHRALAAAPMRIAFNHIPDLTVESDE